MIPHTTTPATADRTAWVAPGCAYGAWVILTAQGEDLTRTRITETPLLDGITGILFTPANLVTNP